MLRTVDLLMIGSMIAAATITYQIKHHADDKLEDVRKLESEIKLEHDTIDLLKADWALLTQPNRLEKLVKVYGEELKLHPTEPDHLARPNELPMRRDQLPPSEIAEGEQPATDNLSTGSVEP